MMDSYSLPSTTENQRISQLLTAQELLNLRNPMDGLPQPIVGSKFSTHSNGTSETAEEKLAVESTIENCKEILSIKTGAKICDLMQGEWKEELNITVTTKLRGKFTQHMGHAVHDKICLYPEESLFLLENGYLEVVNGEKPMSLEEAYSTMLKEEYSLEKYQVYSQLTHLGFIVIPHRKSMISKIDECNAKTCQYKRKRTLPDEPSNKRLTFTGAFSEEINANKTGDIPNIYTIEQSEITEVPAEKERNVFQSTRERSVECIEQLEQNALPSDLVSVCENVLPGDVESLPTDAVKNALNNTGKENLSNLNTCEIFKPKRSIDIEEMDVDSQSTEISLGVSEKSRDAFEAGIVDEASTGTTPMPSQDSQCAVVSSKQQLATEDNCEVISCSSESELLGVASQSEISKNDFIDDEVTLLEVTKKESTVTAVIDLLSEDESTDEDVEIEEHSDSGNEVQVQTTESGLADDKKNVTEALNLKKIKSRKFSDIKNEAANFRVPQESVTLVQFQDLYRQDVVCVPQPPPSFLPNNIKPSKEVYICNISRLHVNLPGYESSPQQGRVWNSFRDLQEHQRARRQNRHSDRPFPRFQGRDNPYRPNRYPKHYDDRSVRSDSSFRDRTPDSCRNDRVSSQIHSYTHYDRISSGTHAEDDYRNHNSSRDRPGSNHTHYSILNDEEDVDYRNRLPCEDRKPLRPTNSPVTNGNDNDSRNCSLPGMFQPPEFRNSSSFSSVVSIRHPGMALNYSNPPDNPLNMSQFPSPVPHFTQNADFAAEVQRTAYSYATTMVSSILGPNFNLNNSNFPPFQQNWNNPLRMPFPSNFNNATNFNIPVAGNNHFLGQNNWRRDFHRRRRMHRGNPFPSSYRNVSNKRSWNDVKATVQGDKQSSSHSRKRNTRQSSHHSESDTSDVEEIPINKNEFLWGSTDLSPLVLPGIQHPVREVLKLLKIKLTPELANQNSSKKEPFPTSGLKISYDVYLPDSKFKKSSPGVPNHRIVVMRLLDPVPQVSEIELLQSECNDGAMLQFAIVDNKDVNFISASNFLIPDIIPFEDK